MTRAELAALQKASAALRAGNGFLCLAHLQRLEIDAEREHAAEDRHHTSAEAEAHPTTMAAE